MIEYICISSLVSGGSCTKLWQRSYTRYMISFLHNMNCKWKLTKITSTSTKTVIRLETPLECFCCSINFTRTRPAKTTSEGNTAGQWTPWHSCLCSAIWCSVHGPQSPTEIQSEIYFSSSSGSSLWQLKFLRVLTNCFPPDTNWHWVEQYSGIEQDSQGTACIGSSLKQKWQLVSRQFFKMIYIKLSMIRMKCQHHIWYTFAI